MTVASADDIIQYHEETKHHLHRYARSAGHMDWRNQPNPFRFYEGADRINLPLLKHDPAVSYEKLYRNQRGKSAGFTLESLAGFLELSLGLSAWKSISGSRWPLRINPSSGNLHPTEAHLVLSSVRGIPGGMYHYSPFLHALEFRTGLSERFDRMLLKHFGTDGFLVALTSIYWRESWKYGERAFRYCHHDIGHALACLRFSANLFGWQLTYLNGVSDRSLATLLGLNQTDFQRLEHEQPDLICFVYPNASEDIPRTLPRNLLTGCDTRRYAGRPNRLSEKPVEWAAVYRAAKLTQKPATPEKRYRYVVKTNFDPSATSLSAAAVIRNRRSATDFDARGSATREQFLSILEKTMPGQGVAPFDVELNTPCLHLLIFAHAVEGLAQGIYFLVRSENDMSDIRQQARPDFLWHAVEAGFPLYLLKEGGFRHTARKVSCDQAIAGDSAFSLGMITRFEKEISAAPYRYRQLYWEAGMIGQVLYLAAEAHGLRGTGIGCFFDDEVHEILGFHDLAYQSIYHFTVGRPLEDPRLASLPPYEHLASVRKQ